MAAVEKGAIAVDTLLPFRTMLISQPSAEEYFKTGPTSEVIVAGLKSASPSLLSISRVG